MQSIKDDVSTYVKDEKKLAWDHYQRPIKDSKTDLVETINNLEKSFASRVKRGGWLLVSLRFRCCASLQ